MKNKLTHKPLRRLAGTLALTGLLCLALASPRAQDPPANGKKTAAPIVQPPLPVEQYNSANPRQVRITARILEWTHDSQIDWGFNINYVPDMGSDQVVRLIEARFPKQTVVDQGLTVDIDKIDPDEENFSGIIQVLEQFGTVRVLSEPNVVVQVGEDVARNPADGKVNPKVPAPKATVSSKSRVPYEAVKPAGNVLAQVTEFKDTAIQLTVNANRVVDNYIELQLDNSVTDLSGFISVALNDQGEPLLVPQTDTRHIANTVLVQNRTIFISGILQSNSEFQRDQGIPWFAQLPIIGFFFKNNQRSESTQELLFLVRPEIVVN